MRQQILGALLSQGPPKDAVPSFLIVQVEDEEGGLLHDITGDFYQKLHKAATLCSAPGSYVVAVKPIANILIDKAGEIELEPYEFLNS